MTLWGPLACNIIFPGVPSLEFTCTLVGTVSPLLNVARFLPLFLRSRWHCFLSLFRMTSVLHCLVNSGIVDSVCWEAMSPMLEVRMIRLRFESNLVSSKRATWKKSMRDVCAMCAMRDLCVQWLTKIMFLSSQENVKCCQL